MNKLRFFREKNNLSIHELARRTEITPSYICSLEKGTRNNPSKEVMEKLAAALNQTVAEVFFPEENQTA